MKEVGPKAEEGVSEEEEEEEEEEGERSVSESREQWLNLDHS